jgi:hypothetical protein
MESLSPPCGRCSFNEHMGLIKSLFIKLGLINRTLRIRERFGKEVLKYCVLNISEEMLVSLVKGLVFNAFEDEVVIIMCAECEREEVEQQAYEIVEMIRGNVEKFLKTKDSWAGICGQSMKYLLRSASSSSSSLPLSTIKRPPGEEGHPPGSRLHGASLRSRGAFSVGCVQYLNTSAPLI